MAETGDRGVTHQIHENTPEEKRKAAVVMADTARRVTKRRKKDRQRARRDLTTVLLLLGLSHNEPEWFEEHVKFQKIYWLMGNQTQFRHRSET